MRIVVEGRSGSGKSTLLASSLRGRGLKIAGVSTARVLGREGERLGFALYPARQLGDSENALLIRSVRDGEPLFLEFIDGKPVFRYESYLQSLKESLDPSATLLVLDEFGGLELLDDEIYRRLREAFAEAPNLILACKSVDQLQALAARAGVAADDLARLLERREDLLGSPAERQSVNLERLGRQAAAQKLAVLLDQLPIPSASPLSRENTERSVTVKDPGKVLGPKIASLQKKREKPGAAGTSTFTPPTLSRGVRRCWILLFLSLGIFFFSFTLGHYPISLEQVFGLFLSKIFPFIPRNWPEAAETALFRIRLPRLVLAALAGGGLSLAGATFQAVFRNPLVSPDVLGAAQGAACGAALAILLGLSSAMITAFSFAGGLLSIVLVLLIASRVRFDQVLALVLTGLVVGSLASASLSLIKLLADPNSQLPAITYWLMGSLASSRLTDLPFAVPCLSLGSLAILLLRWKLNLLTLSEEEAKSLGLRVKELRLALILAATLLTATAVSVSGVIGWIGLVIPHAAALIFGADHRQNLPACFLLGAAFTIAADDLARLLTTSEVPLGILTAFIGAPAFLLLLLREGRSRERRVS